MKIADAKTTLLQSIPHVRAAAWGQLTSDDVRYHVSQELFSWLGCAEPHKGSLLGVALRPLLLLLASSHGCAATCVCLEGLLCWNLVVKGEAEKQGWSPQEMQAPLPADPLTGRCLALLDAAFLSYCHIMQINLTSCRAKARCVSLVRYTQDSLLADYFFSRVARKHVGGWLMVLGPKALWRDTSYLRDALWAADCDLDFLEHLEPGYLDNTPLIAACYPHILQRVPELQTKRFALQVLAHNPQAAKHFRCSICEDPEVALVCGDCLLRGYATLPGPEGGLTTELLHQTLESLRGFEGRASSRLRRMLRGFTDAIAGGESDALLASCQRILRFLRAPQEKHATATGAATTETEPPKGDAPRGQADGDRGAAHKDRDDACGYAALCAEKDLLNLEIQMANERARIEKLAYAKKPLASRKKHRSRHKKDAASADVAPEEEAAPPTLGPGPARGAAGAPPLLPISEKSLEELERPLRMAAGRSKRAQRRREAWERRCEDQRSRLAAVFA